jgi:hypothetical protein
VFFMNLFPGNVLGAELACVFAIFTSQAWNMTFSMYQSMRNVRMRPIHNRSPCSSSAGRNPRESARHKVE